MARVVTALGEGGQRRAEREWGWDRRTLRKGVHAIASGRVWLDAYVAGGRKRAEERLRNWLEEIQAIVDGQSQPDPRFESSRLYTRLSAGQVRQDLIRQKGYTPAELPSEETLRVKLNGVGYRLRTVRKTVPQKSQRD